jgi:hypothetical protein
MTLSHMVLHLVLPSKLLAAAIDLAFVLVTGGKMRSSMSIPIIQPGKSGLTSTARVVACKFSLRSSARVILALGSGLW